MNGFRWDVEEAGFPYDCQRRHVISPPPSRPSLRHSFHTLIRLESMPLSNTLLQVGDLSLLIF